ncbi:MAG: class I SAM-dependent methyltransferase [Candidatus Lokiarchaeota archaeon]|nr:class I SAM-dependent methyltransferase [Candidatus Lokiarchaeota archaeon]
MSAFFASEQNFIYDQETLVIPLWARANDYLQKNSILNDRIAWEVFHKFNYDYSRIEENFGLMQIIAMSVRSKNLDTQIRKFLREHPFSTIINIGAGLGTAFYRIDNGNLKWYDLDLPNVITLRKKIFPTHSRVKIISKSVFDFSWIDDIKSKEDPICFVANGVLMYFEEAEIKKLFFNLANFFPSSEFCFDTHSKVAITVGNKQNLERLDIKGQMRWGFSRIKQFLKWDERIEIIETYPMYAHIKRNDNWSDEIISKMNLVDNRRLANIVHLRFN